MNCKRAVTVKGEARDTITLPMVTFKAYFITLEAPAILSENSLAGFHILQAMPSYGDLKRRALGFITGWPIIN